MTTGPAAVSVLAIFDRSWSVEPGVCCLRHNLRSAFGEAGAKFTADDLHPRVPAAAAGPVGQGRLRRLPAPIRVPVAHSAQAVRETRERIIGAANRQRRSEIDGETDRVHAAASRADLVIAESPGVAETALAAGIPGRRIWAVVLPPERLVAGVAGYGTSIARLSSQIGGFLTDSEAARDSVERAADGVRLRVQVFPPLAEDRSCPDCREFVSSEDAAHAIMDAPPDSGSRALALWRVLRQTNSSAPIAYSDAAARLGERPWLQLQPAWTSNQRADAGDRCAPSWTAAAQNQAAARVIASVEPGAMRRVPQRAVVSGFDLKFISDLAAHLSSTPDLAITLDAWPNLGTPSPKTRRVIAAADTIVAEWARPSAVWLSQRKRPGQRLVVRLHRYEIDQAYPRAINIDNVDAVVHVSKYMGDRIIRELGWPAEKLVFIPNYVDTEFFARPKFADARFCLGMVGIDFANKRFDLALDLLGELRRQDRRFRLQVRSTQPWKNQYAWASRAEREYVARCMSRVENDPLLRGSVIFDEPGRDMPRWFRGVGHVLSMSDVESFHLAVVEGMSSGAVPLIRNWAGADRIYAARWIHDDMDSAVAAVMNGADEAHWHDASSAAITEAAAIAEPARVRAAWRDLLHGDLAAARAYFA